ncbi:hypothetical protein [Cloacibacillus evryensis]|uniref:Uncharacterized protein n=1 Tax=Cloacibacillus evryensis TaxID=508460 RepID=A0AAW5K0X2_9BACT|nr:hypothetical protein [Cloacibacillus evryensis]MCQ4813546.1 hypothetical protein [Cloacibacillus evryensis]
MSETRITREQLDREVDKKFIGEWRVRIYQNAYGMELVFCDGRRFLKLCRDTPFVDINLTSGVDELAGVMQNFLVQHTMPKLSEASKMMRLVSGEDVPSSADWNARRGSALCQIRRAEAEAVFNKYCVLKELEKLPEWEDVIRSEEQDQEVSRNGWADSGGVC